MDEFRFPDAISNTIREAFVVCPRKAYWNFFRRLQPQGQSIHLHAGAAFAKGMEATRRAYYEQKLSSLEAEKVGLAAMEEAYGNFDVEYGFEDSNKSLNRLTAAFYSYWMEYPLDYDKMKPVMTLDNKSAVEFFFTVPMSILHPDTNEPIFYTGKFDMLGVEEGAFWIVDEKTTSQLGASWSKQWDLNSQFTGYCMGARAYGYDVVGARIRGVGLLKTDIKHQQVILSRAQWEIDRWWHQLHIDVKRMVDAYNLTKELGANTFDMALGSACTSYGECSNKILCTSQQPESYVPIYFKPSDYSPLSPYADMGG